MEVEELRVGAILTAVLAATAALWPLGEAAAGVVTPHPFTVDGLDAASAVWDAVAWPTFVAFQVVWLVAVLMRWRAAGRTVRRQLSVVGGAVVSLVALATGLAVRGTPTLGVLAVCLVPIAAGWSIVHSQYLATHGAHVAVAALRRRRRVAG